MKEYIFAPIIITTYLPALTMAMDAPSKESLAYEKGKSRLFIAESPLEDAHAQNRVAIKGINMMGDETPPFLREDERQNIEDRLQSIETIRALDPIGISRENQQDKTAIGDKKDK